MTTTTTLTWNALLLDQLDWHWQRQLRPRLEGLTDEEYLWEPVANCWSVRPRGHARTEMAAGSGDLVIDFAYPEPKPAPVTTIAWRIGHLVVGVFGARVASHFGGPPVDYQTFDGTATTTNNDYQSTSGTLSIPPKTPFATITVPVFGDTKFEGD